MLYPQSFAIEVCRNVENIGLYGCLAMCYMFCVGIDGTADNYILSVSQAIDYCRRLPEKDKFIDTDCTILNASKYLEYLTGKRFDVTKKQIDDISKIKEPTPVRYSYNGHSHWVVVENGHIVFNSLINSQCVSKGKPAQVKNDPNARKITLAK